MLSYELLKTAEGRGVLEDYFGRSIPWEADNPIRYRFPHPNYTVSDLFAADGELAGEVMRLDQLLKSRAL